MPLDLRQVQKYERIKGTMQVALTGVNPYVRLKSGRDVPPLFIQGGKVYSEGGPEIPLDELPEWFWTELDKMTPRAKAECGADRLVKSSADPMEKSKSARETTTPTLKENSQPKPKRYWHCDPCNLEIDTRKKGMHIAFHRRQELKQAAAAHEGS